MELFLGIDAGFSKTNGVIADDKGNILSKFSTVGSATIGIPSKKCCSILLDTINSLCSEIDINRDDISYFGIGLNGVDHKDEHKMQLEKIYNYLDIKKKKIHLVNDGIVALWGASSNSNSVILQYGSGFTSAYRSNFGDEIIFDSLNIGKIIDIRQEVINIVARMIDGRLKPTIIKEMTLEYLDTTEDLFAEYIFKNKFTASKLRNISKIVYDAWINNDKEVDKLIRKAVDDYILVVKTIIKKMRGEDPGVCLSGGLITNAPKEFWIYMKDRFINSLNVSIEKALLPPEYGAIVMTGHNYGINAVEYFNKIYNSYRN